MHTGRRFQGDLNESSRDGENAYRGRSRPPTMGGDRDRDPVEAAGGAGRDLYDIATWEPRTRLDRLAVGLYVAVVRTVRAVVVLVAVAILVAQFALTGLAAVANPSVGAFTLLSIVPALAVVIYVRRASTAMREPLRGLVGTFLLGVLFAGFAAVLNSLAGPGFSVVPLVGMPLFFYLIVGPVEETVKLLAVRLYAFRSDSFDTVVDGAVYGAVAGLGFATIENALYIGQQYLSAMEGTVGASVVAATAGTAAARTFAGPGHVIYSGIAGYYLGLAKFNREHAGPIVVKGILLAAFIHATYNTLVGVVPRLVTVFYPQVPPAVAFIGFVVVFDGFAALFLFRKIARYRSVWTAVDAGASGSSTGVAIDGEGNEVSAPKAVPDDDG